MPRSSSHRFRLGLFRNRREIQSDVEAEIEFHLQMRVAELEEQGLSPAQARAEARRLFGDRDETRDACYRSDLRREHAMQRSEYLLELVQDVRHGLRQLRRRPGFATIVVATLAVGIGATTTIFSAADHVLLRPLPYRDPERVVVLWETDLTTGGQRGVAPGNFVEWQRRSQSFEALGLAESWGSDLARDDGPPDELPAWRVGEGFLEALGVTLVAGRSFVPEEFTGRAQSPTDVPGLLESHSGSGESVLLSEELWRTRYGADVNLLGKALLIDDVARTVVGVVSNDVDYPHARPLWLPKLFSDAEERERTASHMQAVGRLRPNVAIEEAQAEMDGIAAALAHEHPETNGRTGVRLVALEQQVLGGVRPALLVLLGAVAFVLFVACSNVVGLMLANSATRHRELTVRAALGAGRARLLRQLLAESFVIGVTGGAVGLLMAMLGLRAMAVLGPADLPRLETVDLDPRVLSFAIAITLLSSILTGLVPALRSSRAGAVANLKSGDRSFSAGGDGARLRSALVVGEVAVALALLIGAGLLGRSFLLLMRSDLGFETKNRAVLQMFIWDHNPTMEKRLQRAQEIVDRMEAVPGVAKVGIATAVPFIPSGTNAPTPFVIKDRPPLPNGQTLRARPNMTTPAYFEVMSIPLLAGRGFSATDRADATLVAVVNESFARRFFDGASVLGEEIVLTAEARPREVVGVVGDVHFGGLGSEPEPEVFLPFAQSGWGGVIFLAESRVAVETVLPQLRQAVWEVDSGQAIFHSETLGSLLGESLIERRFNLVLLGTFAATSLLLAAIGIYGLISFSASRRTHEIGIRMALGSRRVDVLTLILGQGLRLGLLGIGLGVLLALLLTRFLEHMLYTVEPTDPVTFAALAVFMLLLAILATYLPARRAAGLDPVKALRDE